MDGPSVLHPQGAATSPLAQPNRLPLPDQANAFTLPCVTRGRDMNWRRVFRLPRGKRGIEREVDEELAFHLTMRADRLRREGLEAADAAAEALVRFGDPGP